jgi:hypothetical protein
MKKAIKKAPVGRPLVYDRPRTSIAARLQTDLHERIKSDAEAAGRSISEEIERRLERSFDQGAKRTFDEIAVEISLQWARLSSVFFELEAQGELVRTSKALIEQIENGSKAEELGEAIGAIKAAIRFIERHAAGLPHRVHFGGSQ